MLTIRLQRTGKRNQADFRIVLAEKEAPVEKKCVEVLGSYNPRLKKFQIKNQDRLKYWLDQKVELSPTVHNLLVTNKVTEAPKTKAFNIPKKEQPKQEEAEKTSAEAAPAQETPAAETPAPTDTPAA